MLQIAPWTAFVFLVFLSGCPASPSSPPESAAPALDVGAPPAPAVNVRETAIQTWAAQCASCHGAEGRGDTERGRALRIPDMSRKRWQVGRTNAQLARVIRNGYRGTTQGVRQHMPEFEQLPDNQIRALVALVRGFSPAPSSP